jgi:hypothetical protein
MYMMDQPSKWENYIHLVEFAYNNGYQASLKMSLFEALYGRKCNTLVIWDNIADKVVVGSYLLKEKEEKMEKIKKKLEATQDRKKIYSNNNRVFRYFKVGEHVFLKVKVKRSLLRLESFMKLATRYCGPFEILEKMWSISYMIALSTSMRVNNVFHVSLLKKYVSGPNHIIDWNVIQVEHKGDFRVEPIHIIDRKFKVLRNKSIGLVKVQWTYYSPKDTTWEHEENMWEEYPQFIFSILKKS